MQKEVVQKGYQDNGLFQTEDLQKYFPIHHWLDVQEVPVSQQYSNVVVRKD
jgi:hypothetical protein